MNRTNHRRPKLGYQEDPKSAEERQKKREYLKWAQMVDVVNPEVDSDDIILVGEAPTEEECRVAVQ